MPRRQNVKETAASQGAPQSGWAPHTSHQRLTSQLDAATGQLTGSQQRWYQDMPSEEFSEQPSTSHKLIMHPDGSTEYRQLVAHGAAWKDPASGTIIINGAVRP